MKPTVVWQGEVDVTPPDWYRPDEKKSNTYRVVLTDTKCEVETAGEDWIGGAKWNPVLRATAALVMGHAIRELNKTAAYPTT